MISDPSEGLYLLDYGAGNVRSVFNAVESLGFSIKIISSPADFDLAKKIIFPGVGSFGHAIRQMQSKNLLNPLLKYIASGKPLMGICVGMQVLFEGSEESEEPGLGVFKGFVKKFTNDTKSVPNIGWNSCVLSQNSSERACSTDIFDIKQQELYYFVHSYAVFYDDSDFCKKPSYTVTRYGDQTFVSSICIDNIFATQFHPEKSGKDGLKLLQNFITKFQNKGAVSGSEYISSENISSSHTLRVIACMDIRANDNGELVVTKGDQYDVREASDGNKVRNLGNPVELAKRYFVEGADEIAFLNITSFRDVPLNDTPMLKILQQASKFVFVPMTIGGGIRSIKMDSTGESWTATQVADAYFKAGADKISIGSDAVYSAEEYYRNSRICNGNSSIEEISKIYGTQAVVVSIDPKRTYVNSLSDSPHHTIETKRPGPNGEKYCWFQCTVKGGRENRDIDVVELAVAVEALGAGELLLNSINNDGGNSGYDLELLSLVKKSVRIPVIASSGAGKPSHFLDASVHSNVDAVLAAGIFHRKEVEIQQVKDFLAQNKIRVRN
ncbi:hypothetical protein BB561_004294 [Smittium simulii]|uniref:Imidazole glycerol phosphate synthase hisHF n=1 Tax=Smittium simulii TaxID=133385 RepID=A0A2T9YH08_9FUNG|nr:hypothetical protein BB561_004294 [Smittium simulii]